MTIAFIISALIAGILFLLWQTERQKLIESEGEIQELRKQIEEFMNERAVCIKHTPLTAELVSEVIINNGFRPLHRDAEWVHFKSQGSTYCVSLASLPGVCFYKGFSYNADDDLDILKKAAEMTMNEIWDGRITFTESDNIIAFRVFGFERTLEHFTDSFMDYMNTLDDMIKCHRYFDKKLMDEKQTLMLNEPHEDSIVKGDKILS